MPTYLSPIGLREFRRFFEKVSVKPTPQTWIELSRRCDELPRITDLQPWLDGLCRITIPADLTASGESIAWEFKPDLLEIYPDTDMSGIPKTAQEAINRVYQMAGTAD